MDSTRMENVTVSVYLYHMRLNMRAFCVTKASQALRIDHEIISYSYYSFLDKSTNTKPSTSYIVQPRFGRAMSLAAILFQQQQILRARPNFETRTIDQTRTTHTIQEHTVASTNYSSSRDTTSSHRQMSTSIPHLLYILLDSTIPPSRHPMPVWTTISRFATRQ